MLTIRQTEAFAAWFADLKDREARARIDVRIHRGRALAMAREVQDAA